MIGEERNTEVLAPSVVGEGGLPGTVRAVVAEAVVGRWEALNRLVEVLLEVDAVGDEVVTRSALALVAGVPGLIARLDEHVRSRPWSGEHQEPASRRIAARFTGASSGPAVTVLASMHGDGRIRERAVAAMVGRPCAEVMPFLVVRTADWVGPVRNRARAGLAMLLADHPAAYLPAVLPMVLRLEARLRAGFAVNQVRAAVLAATEQMWRGLLGSGGRRQRRFVFDIVLAQGWLRLPDLVAFAEWDPDVRIRGRAAEAACREAVWTRRHDVLQRLARSARPEVRVVGLTGLMRVGRDADVAGYLDDEAPLVRAVAREAARHLGLDVREHYRSAVDTGVPTLGVIAGLAETGSDAQAPLLRRLLGHELARIRAQAVRGLRLMDAVVAAEAVTLLRDPSPTVVREATLALRPLLGALPPGLPWELLADDRVELRRAGYRLLRGRGVDIELRAALVLAVDADPRLTERGKADVTRLVRDATRPWHYARRSQLHVTVAHHAQLVALADRAAVALGAETSQLLAGWLASSRPSE